MSDARKRLEDMMKGARRGGRRALVEADEDKTGKSKTKKRTSKLSAAARARAALRRKTKENMDRRRSYPSK